MSDVDLTGAEFLVRRVCEACQGGGDLPDGDDGKETCPDCNGDGEKVEPVEAVDVARFIMDMLPRVVISHEEIDATKDKLRAILTSACERAALPSLSDPQRQEALRTATEAVHSIRELTELVR